MYVFKPGAEETQASLKDTKTITTTATIPEQNETTTAQLRKAPIQEVGPWSRPAGRPCGFPDVVVGEREAWSIG